ncbi:MAG: hypothetical protein OEZ39_10775 [Gammaproteobacteria bacterium]|nr:hypothetical protein [Gammaproteobacteria bacterium]MDH5652327.1 hypothetical protein [Gammaproteobacteria bacterium]
MSRWLVLPVVLFLSWQPLQAESARYTVEFGLHGGGDQVPSASQLTAPADKQVDAGGLLRWAVGMMWSMDETFALSVSVGQTINFTSLYLNPTGDNETSWFTRHIDVMALHTQGQWRYGAGLVLHLGTRLRLTNINSGQEWKYDPALGVRLSLEYLDTDYNGYALYYTHVEHKAAGVPVVDGSSLGVVLRWYL